MKKKNERPTSIFVVGSGRSGTTALFDCLVESFSAAYLPRVSKKARGLTPLAIRAAGNAPVRRLASSLLSPCAESSYLYDVPGVRPEDTQRRGRPIELEEVPADWRERASATIQLASSSFSSDTFVSKSTANCARVRALSLLDVDVKIVFVTRDPRSVALSLEKVTFWADMFLWWRGTTVAEAMSSGVSSVDVALEHWVHQNAAILDAFADPQVDLDVKTISYEEFCGRPDATVVSIASWSDVNSNDTDIEAASAKVRSLNALPFDDSLTDSAIRIAGPMAEMLGYAL